MEISEFKGVGGGFGCLGHLLTELLFSLYGVLLDILKPRSGVTTTGLVLSFSNATFAELSDRLL